MNNRRIIVYLILAAFGCASWTFKLDDYYRDRSLEISRFWKNFDHLSPNGGHLVERFTSFQNAIATSSFVKGIAVFDSSKSLLAQYPDNGQFLIPNPDSVYPTDKGISINSSGFFKYNTSILIENIEEKYLFIFYFHDDDSTQIFLTYILIIFLILFTLILLEHLHQKSLLNDYSSSSISRAHELDSLLTLGKDLATGVFEDDNGYQTKKFACHYLKGYRIVHTIQTDMLNINAKTEIYSPKYLDLKETINEFFECLNSDISHISVSKSFTHSNNIYGDDSKIFSIVSNLLRNAIKYTEGFIRISTFDQGNYVTLSVITVGQTIPKKYLRKIFKPFARVPRKSAANTSGTGMGLFILYKYVKVHKGKVEVSSSNGVNEFKVSLPASKPLAPKNSDNRNVNLSIAVIDDERFNEDIIRKKLGDLDYSLRYYPNPQKFLLDYNLNLKFDIVIVDRFCQGGFDAIRDNFAKFLKTKLSFTGIICLYSNSRAENLEDYFDFAFHKSENLEPLIDRAKEISLTQN